MTDVADALRAHFDTGATATRRWRVTQLRALRDLLRQGLSPAWRPARIGLAVLLLLQVLGLLPGADVKMVG